MQRAHQTRVRRDLAGPWPGSTASALRQRAMAVNTPWLSMRAACIGNDTGTTMLNSQVAVRFDADVPLPLFFCALAAWLAKHHSRVGPRLWVSLLASAFRRRPCSAIGPSYWPRAFDPQGWLWLTDRHRHQPA